jgi:hypothetical protein
MDGNMNSHDDYPNVQSLILAIERLSVMPLASEIRL